MAESEPLSPEAFLDLEAQRNPVPALETAVKVADAFRRGRIIQNRKARTHALLTGQSIEEPRRAPAPMAAHLAQPRARGKR